MSECCGPGCNHPDCNGDRPTTPQPGSVDDFNRRLAEIRDPIVKYDGNGQPVRASDLSLGNRAERRAAAREARRRW